MKKTLLIISGFMVIGLVGIIIFFRPKYKDNTNEIMKIIKTSDITELVKEINKPLINEELEPILKKYVDFKNILYKANRPLPFDGRYIPQGITVVDNDILITAYDGLEEDNSKCYILDMFGNLKKVVDLKSKTHAGSIGYDTNNNLIWIPEEKGILNAYDKDNFLNGQEVDYKYQFKDIGEGLLNYKNKQENDLAYLTIDGNSLFVGSFGYQQAGIVKEYKIKKDKEISLEYVNRFKVPDKVQSIAFYQKGQNKYLWLGRSYGRNRESFLDIYLYKEDITSYNEEARIGRVVLPPMMEQITIIDNKVYTVFESMAWKYEESLDKNGYVNVFLLDKILDIINVR